MKEEIRFAQYGCGKMGSQTLKYAIEGGAQLVAAFDVNPELIRKDVGKCFGIDNVSVKISHSTEAEAILSELKPDICIITTRSLMKEIKDILLICAKIGINVITTCEEAFYPWNSSPVMTKEIDELAKKNNCTITGSGANEAQYGSIFALYGGVTHKTDKIIAKALYNVDEYGIALAEAHGVGLTAEEFEATIAAADNISEAERDALISRDEFLPSYVWNANGWFCDFLGLTVKCQSQKSRPKFADIDIESKTLGEVIPKGRVIGMGAEVVTETEENITIISECIGIVYGQGEEDRNESISYGVPNTECYFKNPDTVGMTCSVIVNRIPDVINAPPGFVTTSQMPNLKYRVKPLHKYVSK